MRPALLALATASTAALAPALAAAQGTAPDTLPPPERTEVWQPVPPVVTPGPAGPAAAPPSDAVVLFDGRSLAAWVSTADRRRPAGWTVRGGVLTVNKAAGDIETRQAFGDCQVHLEWRVPPGTTETGQARGNSGLFFAAPGPGGGYEIQILDSYRNATYVNGQAASVYKQHPPLANAMRPPGAWQTYDVVWTAPTFGPDGALRAPARVTVFHNGVLVQRDVALAGQTLYRGTPHYVPHGPTPIRLQAHGDPSPPISFRNIWVRPLPARPAGGAGAPAGAPAGR